MEEPALIPFARCAFPRVVESAKRFGNREFLVSLEVGKGAVDDGASTIEEPTAEDALIPLQGRCQ
jgi:hypothetical protein